MMGTDGVFVMREPQVNRAAFQSFPQFGQMYFQRRKRDG